MSALPETVTALTGTMGAGKSTAAAILRKWFPVLDLDAVNADILQPGKAGYAALDMDWIPHRPDGAIDRKEMAARMFADPQRKKEVESILHPLLVREMEAWIQAQSGDCFVEVPLLFEAGLQDRFDQVWCITCSQQTALERLENGRHISRKEALERLAHQWPARQKASGSDVVIHNDGSLQELEQKLKEAVHGNH